MENIRSVHFILTGNSEAHACARARACVYVCVCWEQGLRVEGQRIGVRETKAALMSNTCSDYFLAVNQEEERS